MQSEKKSESEGGRAGQMGHTLKYPPWRLGPRPERGQELRVIYFKVKILK